MGEAEGGLVISWAKIIDGVQTHIFGKANLEMCKCENEQIVNRKSQIVRQYEFYPSSMEPYHQHL